MQQLAQRGYTTVQVEDTLRGRYGTVQMTFRYHIVNSQNQFVEDITGIVVSGEVGMDWTAPIKRNFKASVNDFEGRSWQSIRVQPWVRVLMPPYGPQDFVEYPQGVYTVSAPQQTADDADNVTRALECFDLTKNYSDDLFTARYTVAAGATYTTAIATLLGSVPRSITSSTKILPAAKEWVPGDAKLTAINELLAAINYNQLHTDPAGNMIVEPYVDPNLRSEEFEYLDNEVSVTVPGMTRNLDLFSVPNRWVRVVSDPDRPYLISVYTNSNPASSTSTVARGRVITDFDYMNDVADQTTLNARTKKIAQDASAIYEAVSFNTGIIPVHSGNDCYHLKYGPLGIDGKYTELQWSMPLSNGAQMSHSAQRLVQV